MSLDAMKQALEVLEFFWNTGYRNIAPKQIAAMDALRAAIEQAHDWDEVEAQRVFDRNVVLQAINDLNEIDAVLEACRVKQDVGTDCANAVLCYLLKSLDGAYLQPKQEEIDELRAALNAEREACIDLVAMYGGPVDLEAAIRARGEK